MGAPVVHFEIITKNSKGIQGCGRCLVAFLQRLVIFDFGLAQMDHQRLLILVRELASGHQRFI